MEFTKVELQAVEVASKAKRADEARELESLELALVGGGIGDVIW